MKEIEIEVNAAVRVHPLPRAQKRETRIEEVTELELDVAAIRRNAQNAFDKCVRILSLNVCLGNQWVEPASKVCANVKLPLVASRSGVSKICVGVAGNDDSEKRCQDYTTLGQVVADIGCEILK